MSEQANLDASRGLRGRAVRNPVYVITTSKNHDRLAWAEVARAPRAWVLLLASIAIVTAGVFSWLLAVVLAVAGVAVMYLRQASFPVVLAILGAAYLAVFVYDAHYLASIACAVASAFFFGARAWALSPSTRNPGARHCLLAYTSNGFWHTDQFIAGRGEMTSVVVSQHGPVPASWSVDRVLLHIGEVDEEAVRVVKTYRRSPGVLVPFGLHPTTSTGYCTRRLGISNLAIRRPIELADYCENTTSTDEVRTGPDVSQ